MNRHQNVHSINNSSFSTSEEKQALAVLQRAWDEFEQSSDQSLLLAGLPLTPSALFELIDKVQPSSSDHHDHQEKPLPRKIALRDFRFDRKPELLPAMSIFMESILHSLEFIRITRVQQRGMVCKLFHGLFDEQHFSGAVKIKNLSLHQVNFCGCDNGFLLQQLVKSPSFSELCLQNCSVDEAMLECLAKGLGKISIEHDTRNVRLGFQWCNLTDQSLVAFVNALPESTYLEHLEICYSSSLTPDSISYIARIVEQQTNLQSLEVMWNGSLLDGNSIQFSSLYRALEQSPSIRRLCMKCHSLRNTSISGIFAALENNLVLNELVLRGGDSFTLDDTSPNSANWVHSIPKLKGLRDLDLPDHLWSQNNWSALFMALHQNLSLVEYREGYAGTSTEDPALLPFLQRNQSLMYVTAILERQDRAFHFYSWPLILETLGSCGNNEGTPIFELLRGKGTEVCHHDGLPTQRKKTPENDSRSLK